MTNIWIQTAGSHSITLFARNKTEDRAPSTPRALAVLRFTASSNFAGRSNRKIGRPFAAQYPVGIGRKPNIGRALVRAIAQKSAGIAIFAPPKHRGKTLRKGKLCEFGSMHHRHGVRKDNYRIGAHLACPLKRLVQFTRAEERKIDWISAQRLGGPLSGLPFRLFAWMIGVR